MKTRRLSLFHAHTTVQAGPADMPLPSWTRRAASMRAAPPGPGGLQHTRKPSCRICSPPVTAIRAVAPPGGCTVPLSSMTAMAVGTQRHTARGGSHCAQATPTRAEKSALPADCVDGTTDCPGLRTAVPPRHQKNLSTWARRNRLRPVYPTPPPITGRSSSPARHALP